MVLSIYVAPVTDLMVGGGGFICLTNVLNYLAIIFLAYIKAKWYYTH